MKKKIISLILCIVLCLCVGCSSTTVKKKPTPSVKGEVQYSVAFNPSVILESGDVVSLRNNLAKSISSDVNSKESSSLYNGTPWLWLAHEESGEWLKRLIRNVDLWKDSKGQTNNGVTYCYNFNDGQSNSLMPYDTSKMDVKGHNEGELGASGVIMSFTGSEEEAVCYTAYEDQIVSFGDVSGGKISLVSSVSGIDTDFLKNENAKLALLLKVYKNNRIYWQEVLHGGQTAVNFPEISELKLLSGDKIIFTIQPIDDFSNMEFGYCDLPAYSVEKTKLVEKEVLVKKETLVEVPDESLIDIIPFIVDEEPNFTLVRSENSDKKILEIVNRLNTKMNENYSCEFSAVSDTLEIDGPAIYIMNTNNKNSQSILKEITDKRVNNAADFIIRTVGNDVFIVANNNISLELAVEFFLNNYCKKEFKGISKDLNYVSSNFSSLKDIKLADNNISEFKLVVSHCASRLEMEAAEYFRKEIVKLSGYLLPIINDLASTAAKEICFGNTNRYSHGSSAKEYSLLATKTVDYAYKINVTDKNTTITSGISSAVYPATLKLVEMLSKEATLSKGEYTGTSSESDTLWDGYKLAWSDEFNGEKVGKTWATNAFTLDNLWGGTQLPSSSNYELEDGAIKITAKAPIGGSKDNTIGTLVTLGSERMYFRYGYLEGRVRFPKTPGVCCNLWTKGDLGSEFIEVDLCETFGRTNKFVHTIHRWGDTHIQMFSHGVESDSFGNEKTFSDEFHTVGFEWGEDYMKFYVDGELTSSITGVDLESFKKPCYVIIHAYLVYGTYSPVKLPDDFVSDYVLWDYIRIYQKQDEESYVFVKGK